MAAYNLTTPLTEEMVRKLRVYDVVTLNGTIFGLRNVSQTRIREHRMDLPVSLKGAVCVLLPDPGIKKIGGRWQKVCVGTSTSMPMDRIVPDLIETYGVRGIMGRAGLSQNSLEIMKKFGACYFAIPGGVAAWVTSRIVEVEAVHWEDAHPEALYQFKVKDFGTLSVTMDSHGNNLYSDVKAQVEKKLPGIYKRLGIPV
jgi:L(+)-tartrate dehydratase beta subunit